MGDITFFNSTGSGDGGSGLLGRDGKSPYIGENGNWFSWNDTKQSFFDTGVKAQGEDGSTGKDGKDGKDGVPGRDGQDGMPGIGVPIGGYPGQVLTKRSDNDFDTRWADPIERLNREEFIPAEHISSDTGNVLVIGTDDKFFVPQGTISEDGIGLPGRDGKSPYIGVNGNWFEWDDATLSFNDTGIQAQGQDGAPGPQTGTLTDILIAGGAQAIGTSQIRNIRASTTDLISGTSSLPTGELYLVYE